MIPDQGVLERVVPDDNALAFPAIKGERPLGGLEYVVLDEKRPITRTQVGCFSPRGVAVGTAAVETVDPEDPTDENERMWSITPPDAETCMAHVRVARTRM